MPLAEISAALTATSHAVKLAVSVLKTVKTAEVKEAVSELQDSLIDLQQKMFTFQAEHQAVLDAKRELEQKLAERERWEALAARYRLTEIVSGIFVYSLQPEHQNGEPRHWLCPNCFEQRKRSVLGKPVVENRNFKCPSCSFEIIPIPLRRQDDIEPESWPTL